MVSQISHFSESTLAVLVLADHCESIPQSSFVEFTNGVVLLLVRYLDDAGAFVTLCVLPNKAVIESVGLLRTLLEILIDINILFLADIILG